ncbi:unnamed protein product [Gulo gulo]|uniref:Uncharacterized protein n=1 Tax=Gulo gulo TaxID=48420 RepID=A0A9X9MCG2_GULGU|nr:unnamed protein product [Gulo gulo]
MGLIFGNTYRAQSTSALLAPNLLCDAECLTASLNLFSILPAGPTPAVAQLGAVEGQGQSSMRKRMKSFRL